MNKIFVREIDDLKENILRMAGDIEKCIETVFSAIANHEKDKLLEVMESDRDIDAREVEIEEECLKILALHQPVARDLRFVIAVMKINNDLERVGDIMVNIADRGVRLEDYHECDLFDKIRKMAKLAQEMLHESLSSLISIDVAKAVAVIKRDDELDALNVEVIQSAIARAARDNSEVGALFLYHSMARDIERIGDHATNIAEDVAYLADGWIIRHGNKNFNTGGENVQGENSRR